MKGSVVVIPFPFSDLTGSKRRPALVIADWGGADIMLCQITSKARSDGHEVDLNASDFVQGKLPIVSHIRRIRFLLPISGSSFTLQGSSLDRNIPRSLKE